MFQKRMSMVLWISLALFLFPILAAAQTADSANFSVRAHIPDNQINTSQSYFDLLMQPGQSQTLSVDVINSGTEEITVDVALHAASTNRNGLIEYQVKVEPDETLKFPFDTIAGTPSQVTVAPGGIQKVDIAVVMPNQEFDGVVLGGIVFTKQESGGETSGIAIHNQFSYVVGVILSENDKKVPPDFSIQSIKPTLVNYRRAVVVNIHNPMPVIIKNATLSGYVYRKNETTPLLSINKKGVDMAPNSVFPMPAELGDEDLVAGDYKLKLTLEHNGKLWEWDQDFSIDPEQAGEVNGGALDKPVKANWWTTWWWVLVLAVVIVFLLWFAFMLGRRKRDDEKND